MATPPSTPQSSGQRAPSVARKCRYCSSELSQSSPAYSDRMRFSSAVYSTELATSSAFLLTRRQPHTWNAQEDSETTSSVATQPCTTAFSCI